MGKRDFSLKKQNKYHRISQSFHIQQYLVSPVERNKTYNMDLGEDSSVFWTYNCDA